ncbi:MAG: STAS domain-containing protein [Treponemataceae bacterium]|nr:STAS domain-containing protein [Treponemataceae bacterium]
MEQLTITRKEGADYILFELSGVFNAYTAVNVQSKVYDAIQKQNVVLDLSKVVELDAAAMGTIMAAHNDADECGTKLYLMSLSNEADREILATGFKDLFHIIHSVTEVA